MAIFLQHLANTSSMASIQGWTEAPAALSREHSSCLSVRPASCCSPQRLKFHAHPSRPAWQFNTEVQVNNTAVPHLMHTYTHVHITLVLLSVPFSTLLLPPLADRLAQTLPIWHSDITFFKITSIDFIVVMILFKSLSVDFIETINFSKLSPLLLS
jgi:hypothetical protein